MLHLFLEKNRNEILGAAEEKSRQLAGPLLSSAQLRLGLPIFYDYLIAFLKNPAAAPSERHLKIGASNHGKESLRLHYSLSHVVHAYGAMCQAITEAAQQKGAGVSAQEFNSVNMCLDVAIASAVSEFHFRSNEASEAREVEHLGSLAHELRNALSSVTVAHDMIKRGVVGTGGSTARILEENLARMQGLIDRSLSEVRLRADPMLLVEKFGLNLLIDQILITARNEALKKQQIFSFDYGAEIEMETDRQMLLSVLANLIQNASKFSKKGGEIAVRATLSGPNVVIEVEDECGGLDPKALDNMFTPFQSSSADRSGLGLGLSIVQRGVLLLQGKVSVRNSPARGCAFIIDIPREVVPIPSNRGVSGEDSVQPKTTSRLMKKSQD